MSAEDARVASVISAVASSEVWSLKGLSDDE